MGRLTLTVFHDPRAKDNATLAERLSVVCPSLRIGVTYVDITQDQELMKRYEKVAPVGTIAGTLVFTGKLDEGALRKWVKQLQKR